MAPCAWLAFFLCLDTVSGLKCYITSFQKILKHQLHDCDVYVQCNKMERATLPQPDDYWRCYSVEVESDKFDVMMKGCMENGGCNRKKAPLKPLGRAKCYECDWDGCNTGSGRSLGLFLVLWVAILHWN